MFVIYDIFNGVWAAFDQDQSGELEYHELYHILRQATTVELDSRLKVGAVDCASKPGRELCDRESVVRLPSVRLYADGARDTLAGPAALARGDGCALITPSRFDRPHSYQAWRWEMNL